MPILVPVVQGCVLQWPQQAEAVQLRGPARAEYRARLKVFSMTCGRAIGVPPSLAMRMLRRSKGRGNAATRLPVSLAEGSKHSHEHIGRLWGCLRMLRSCHRRPNRCGICEPSPAMRNNTLVEGSLFFENHRDCSPRADGGTDAASFAIVVVYFDLARLRASGDAQVGTE